MHSSTVFATAALAAVAQAHMYISNPVPFTAGTMSSTPKNPLDANGDDFPCKGAALGAASGPTTPMKVGDSQTLEFALGGGANTAVHGGGSCQLSVTYETDATAAKDPANWHVIYSIIGGCPAIAAGNLNTATACTGLGETECVNSFPFTLPKELANGNATLAWTWQNAIGNREFYMNCANIEISGGASDQSQLSSLPAMFVGNLNVEGYETCQVPENHNVVFPDPGQYVLSNTPTSSVGPSETMTNGPPVGSCGPTSGSSPAQTTGAAGGSSPASSSAAGGSMPTSFSAPAGGAASSSAPVATVIPVASSATSAVLPSPTPYSGGSTTPSSSNSTGGACAEGSVSCSTPGAVVCVGSSGFGICDINNCAVSQSLAAGTSCSDGVVAKVKKMGRRGHAKRHASFHDSWF